jgi:formamidopyrimidine-DNA glycosylase
MPELPEVESVQRRIAPAMVGSRIIAVELRRPDLRRPFPRRFAARLAGQTILALTRRAKYLLAPLSSGETLLMHLGMSGSFRVVQDPGAGGPRAPLTREPHDHVVFHLSSNRAVVFNDPRRFGVMDLVPRDGMQSHATLAELGPEPLSDDFDARALARACRRKRTSLKAALLDQRVVAGLGNIYASEALHLAGLSPRRPASILATSDGAPREAAHRLAAAIKKVLRRAIARQVSGRDHRTPFLVYERQDQPCLKQQCRGVIRHRMQAGRSTYYCSICQR